MSKHTNSCGNQITTDAAAPANLRSSHGLACPLCGQSEMLCIEVIGLANLTARGIRRRRGTFWNDLSDCVCPRCRHSGTVDSFGIGAEVQPCR